MCAGPARMGSHGSQFLSAPPRFLHFRQSHTLSATWRDVVLYGYGVMINPGNGSSIRGNCRNVCRAIFRVCARSWVSFALVVISGMGSTCDACYSCERHLK